MLNKVDLLELPEKVTWTFSCAVTQGVMVAQQCHFQGRSRATPGIKILKPPSEMEESSPGCAGQHDRRGTQGQPEKGSKKQQKEGEGEEAWGVDADVNEEAE